eukprot:jgi/Galph1/392/GphlegSOOS_G5066.1
MGHEYVRHLAGEISREHEKRIGSEQKKADFSDIMALVEQIVPFLLSSNAEPEACDLLYEVESLKPLVDYAEEVNYERICLYLLACADYVPEPDVSDILHVTYIYHNDPDKDALEDVSAVKTQLVLDLAKHNIFLEEETDENLRNLDIMEPKHPEDIYKSHLVEGMNRLGLDSSMDSARQNLAATFVNAFVNLGFGKDKLLMEDEGRWVFRNKEHGMLSATASYGALMLWDVDNGLAELDKYMYASEDYVQAENPRSPAIRISAILGLGFAYAGTCRAEVQELLIPIVADASASLDSICFAALSLGLVFRGSADEELVSTLMQALLDRDWNVWETEPMVRLLPLSLAMLYFGRNNGTDAVIEALEAQLPGMPGRVTALLISIFGSSGTGDVLKIQELLNICGKHPSTKSDDENDESLEQNNRETNSSSEPTHDASMARGEDAKDIVNEQMVACLGIAAIAMREDIGTDMAFRLFGHLLQYADPTVRKVVPLALGLLSVSYPRLQVMDLLSKLTHDNDREVAYAAVLALGFLGAGTNHARMHLYFGNFQFSIPKTLQVYLLFVFLKVTLSPMDNERFSSRPRMLYTVDKELNPIAVPVRVGQATHTTPVVIAGGERAELATEEYIAVDASLEGLVVLVKNPQYVKMEDA